MALTTPKKKAPSATKKTADASADAAATDKVRPDEALPDKAEIARLQEQVRSFLADSRHDRARLFLERLSASPPQVLLLEGGTADERLAAAHYWTLLLNCPGKSKDLPSPCLDCPECIRMLTHLHRDCFYFDGLAASIKIDEVRALRSVLGEPPREAAFRVVIFREAQSLVEAAANALLKSFEEPRPGTSFIMLAPQRERLLPTLVSRSFTLPLPWPRSDAPKEAGSLASWEETLCHFLQTGQGFFEKSGTRGAVDSPLAHSLINMCRRALVAALAGEDREGHKNLHALFSRIPEPRLRMLDEALAECQDSLILGVNPALVVEWLGTRLFFLYPR